MRLRGCGVAVGAVLLAALAACGGSSDAADPSSPTPITRTLDSTSVPAGATPTPAVDPNSDAAIIAGVRAWVASLNVASARVTIAPLVNLATKDCTCIGSLASATQYLSQHGLHLNVNYFVQSASVVAHKGPSATVKVTTRNAKYEALQADGRVVKEEPAGTASNQYSMVLHGNRWLIDAIV